MLRLSNVQPDPAVRPDCAARLSRRLRRGLALALVLWVGCAASFAQAPADNPDPFRFVVWTGQDVPGLGRALISREALYAVAGMGGLLLTLSGQDEDVTRTVVEWSEGSHAPARKIANEIGNVKAVRPMALILFLGSLTSDNRRLQDAAFTSLEAIIFANLITDTLKGVSGRARPFQEEGATRFRPFSGDTSFPSGHSTTVFAFTTPWLLYYANVQTTGLFLLGIGTVFARLADNVHWFTDVVTGASIGFTMGYWLTRRHQRAGSGLSVTPIVSAEQGGVALRVRL